MALYTQASDIYTKQTIWVSTNVLAGRAQLNSHRDDTFGRCYQREQIDGFPAWELAGLHSDYVGNDFQSKIVAFQEKWAEVVDAEVEVAEG
jgi:hypothetical protein